jgi:hypothetical protein
MEVSDGLHAPVAFSLEKELSIPDGQQESFFPCKIGNMAKGDFLSCSLIN